jgi:hypothetical protein
MPVPQDYTRNLVTRHCDSRCFGPAACDINEEADRRPAIHNIDGGCGDAIVYLGPKGSARSSNGMGIQLKVMYTGQEVRHPPPEVLRGKSD